MGAPDIVVYNPSSRVRGPVTELDPVAVRDAVERAHGVAASSLKSEKRQGMCVHGRKGEACPVCGDTVRQVIYADSTFEYCATCQTGGKPLADRVLSRLGVRR